jgi:hypothetical protein
MEYILGALAVYKLLQVVDLLLPKEPMTWVKVLAGIVASYAVSFLVDLDNMVLGGLIIATLAGACHTVLRCLTLMGDMAFRKSLK